MKYSTSNISIKEIKVCWEKGQRLQDIASRVSKVSITNEISY